MRTGELAALLRALISYLDAHPWITGLLGWSLVTFVWENFVKRRNARRGLAHMLADEVAINLQLAVAQRAYSLTNPNAIPEDLHFSNVAFDALTSRLAELPRRYVGEVTLYYERVWQLNHKPLPFAETLAHYKEVQRDTSKYPPAELYTAKRALDRHLTVYKALLDGLIERSNVLLPALRVTSTFGGRFGYWFVKKRWISPEQIARDVYEHEKKLRGEAD